MSDRPNHEPHKIKTVRLLHFPTLQERKKHLAAAHFNVFHLTPSQISFDMVARGANASSQEQLSGQLIGDEAYAGARNFETLQGVVRDTFGHQHVCPTHNNLGSLKLIVATMVSDGKLLPSNARGYVDVLSHRGVSVPDVRDHKEPVFTGNVNMKALEVAIAAGNVALIHVHTFADGQHPISIANLEQVRRLAIQHGLRLVLDASRIIENAWYVQKHEKGWADRPISDIVRHIAGMSTLLHIDGAQDPKCNTGGLLSTNRCQ